MIKISKEELKFLNNLRDNPNDEAIRLIYADWLDEHNEENRANYLRTLVKVRKDYEEMQTAKRNVDRDWLNEVSGGTDEEYEAYVALKGLTLQPLTVLLEMMEKAQTVASVNFNTLLGDTIKEKYESLYVRLIEVENIVLRASTKEGDMWLCTSPEIASIFETMTYTWTPTQCYSPARKISADKSPQYIGASFRIKFYIHHLFPQNMILLGVGRGELPPENLARFRLDNFII